jgi:hypothetical protein
VAVVFEGCEWRLKVPPTPEGALRFQRQIELITGLPFNEQVKIKLQATLALSTGLPQQLVQCPRVQVNRS